MTRYFDQRKDNIHIAHSLQVRNDDILVSFFFIKHRRVYSMLLKITVYLMYGHLLNDDFKSKTRIPRYSACQSTWKNVGLSNGLLDAEIGGPNFGIGLYRQVQLWRAAVRCC